MSTQFVMFGKDLSDRIANLDDLLEKRERLRRLFAFFQDAGHTSSNPVFLAMMEVTAAEGRRTNSQIQDWADRVQLQFSAPAEWEAGRG